MVMTMATLEVETSLTIKLNLFIHPPPILSPHQYLDFVHSLSLTQCHPVASLGQHVCHITTFHVHFCIWCSHKHFLATPVLVHSGDACWHATLPPTIPRSCTLTFISAFTIFTHPCMQTCLTFHTSILAFACLFVHINLCTLGMGLHSTQNIILLLFQECSRNVLQSCSQCMADVTVHVRLNMKLHHLFSLSSLG